MVKCDNNTKDSLKQGLDKILTHHFIGLIIFFLVMWLIFKLTFGLGYYPMLLIEHLIIYIESLISTNLPDGIIKALLIDGIFKGVGGVIIFFPNIIILFMLLSLMEETGYMARVILIMERIMKPFGLNGKSFISLVMGFGCNVPAIMSAQTIQNRSTRIITILINPLMSCSSKFTVYVLFISAFFPSNSGSVLFIIYMINIIIALLLAVILKRFVLKEAYESYTFDLPRYKIPSFIKILKTIWFNTQLFLRKIGGAILIASIVIWLLGYFPHNPSGKNNIEQSYIGKIGKFIEPVISPLGFDWRMGISIVSGIAAKETIVGTLSELFQSHTHKKGENDYLIYKLHQQVYTSGEKTGQKVFTPLIALSFMFFVSIYTPCIATITTIRRTTASLKWTLFVLLYTTLLAWLVAFSVYRIGLLWI